MFEIILWKGVNIMISKERLEELIKEGATIYAIVKKPFIAGYSQILEVEEFDLKAPIVKEISEDGKQFLYFNYLLELEYLFETKEDACWELEMTATRTETLKLPKWEEFIQNDKQVIFYDKDKTYYLDKVMNRTHIIIGYKCIIDLNEELEANRYNFYRKPATKENYIEACKLCLKLFKGEK